MKGLEILFYRPDKLSSTVINPDLCYTLKGQNYREWQRDQEELYQYRVHLAKHKLDKLPSHKVLDYWR